MWSVGLAGDHIKAQGWQAMPTQQVVLGGVDQPLLLARGGAGRRAAVRRIGAGAYAATKSLVR